MTRDEIVALLERHREGFAGRNAEALAAAHAEDGTFESPAHGIVRGRAKILEVYRFWFNAFPDLELTWNDPIVDGHRAAVFWSFKGTSSGPFFGALGVGSRVEMRGAAEYVFADGSISSIRHIFDFSGVLMRTGVLKVKPT